MFVHERDLDFSFANVHVISTGLTCFSKMTPWVFILKRRMLLSFRRVFIEFLTKDRFFIAGFPVKNIQNGNVSVKTSRTNDQFRACGVIYKKEGKLVIILTARLPSIFGKKILTS